MRAFVLRQYGSAPGIGEVEEPVPDGARVAVPVIAAGLNPVDVAIAEGELGTATAPPRVLGNEAVVLLGDRLVYSQRTSGAFAEHTLVDPQDAIDVLDGIAPEAVFAAGIAGQPAWIPLETTAAVRAGETVLVLGATGAAGQVATQAARLLGAGRVVAAGRHVPTLELLRSRGADETVVLGGPDDAANLLDATRGGADVVYDPLWGPPFVAALQATKPGGRTVSVGRSAGAHGATIPVFSFLGKTMLSYRNGATDPQVVRHAFERMLRHVAAGELVVETVVHPLAAAGDAWAAQRATPHGKVVLRVA